MGDSAGLSNPLAQRSYTRSLKTECSAQLDCPCYSHLATALIDLPNVPVHAIPAGLTCDTIALASSVEGVVTNPSLSACRVVRSATGAWLQEEVRVVEGRPELAHLPLGDAWIRKGLEAALEVDSEVRGPSLWQRLLDAAVGGGRACPADPKVQSLVFEDSIKLCN